MSHSIDEDRQRCEPCALDGDNADAEGFCVKCVEYLCKGCVKDHRKNKATRGHRVLSGDEVPSDCSVFKRMNELMLCSEHPEITFKYKCESHDQFICSKCLTNNHRKCDKVVEISSIRSNETNDQQLVHKLTETLGDVSTQRVNNETGIQHMSNQQKEIETSTSKFIDELMDKLKMLSSKLNTEANELVQKEILAANEDISKCAKLEKEIQLNEHLLEVVKNFGDGQEMSVIAVVLKETLERYQSEMAEMSTKREVRIEFKENTSLNGITDIGTITSWQTDRRLVDKVSRVQNSSNEMRNTGLPRQVNQQASRFLIKTPTDKQRCCISGSSVLPNGCLVFTDSTNEKIKVFRSNYDLAFEYSLDGTPIDFCLVNQMAVVVFKNKKIVKCYCVVERMKGKQGYSTDFYSLRITKYRRDNQVLILMSKDKNGRGIRDLQVRNGLNGQYIKNIGVTSQCIGVGDIQCILFHDNRLLVTEYEKLICYTIVDNKLKQEWVHTLDIKDASYVDREENGNIYIVGKRSNQIIISLNRQGKEYASLVSDIASPASLVVIDNGLVVGCECNDYVYVFKFM